MLAHTRAEGGGGAGGHSSSDGLTAHCWLAVYILEACQLGPSSSILQLNSQQLSSDLSSRDISRLFALYHQTLEFQAELSSITLSHIMPSETVFEVSEGGTRTPTPTTAAAAIAAAATTATTTTAATTPTTTAALLILAVFDFAATRAAVYNLSHWAVVREAQRRVVTTTPGMSLIPAIDQGSGNDPHPLNKWDIAQRLQVILPPCPL